MGGRSMHERSLVRALIRQVEHVVADNGGRPVAEVRVKVGPLSGVEPLLLRSAFEHCAPATCAANAKLVIDEVPLIAVCEGCDHTFELADYRFRCPRCEAESVRVTQGDDFQLVSVTIGSTEPAGGIAS